MRVFISWSGDRSRAVAELLDEWLRCVLQAISPWMSTKDIDRGSLWFSEISDQLKDTKIGIVCLTAENKEKPWILFEAGALAKGISSSRVCTFLVDLEATDIANPLAQFNHTKPERDGLYELVRTLNSALGERALPEKVLERVFETYWSQFEARFQEIIAETAPATPEPKRTEESMTVEVLRTVRALDRRIRGLERRTMRNEAPSEQVTVRDWLGAEASIKSMLDAGVSPDAVVQRYRDQLPTPMLKRLIVDTLERQRDESPANDE